MSNLEQSQDEETGEMLPLGKNALLTSLCFDTMTVMIEHKS